MKFRALLAGVAILALAAPNALAAGYLPASASVRSLILSRFAEAHSIFANCPRYNRVALGDDPEGIGCEFRFKVGPNIREGVVAAAPDSADWKTANWTAVAPYFSPPLPPRNVRCSRRGLPENRDSFLRFVAFRVRCGLAAGLAEAIKERLKPNHRLPDRFVILPLEYGTLGFVITRYECRAKVRVVSSPPGSEQPEVGREWAYCHNRFGDHFLYRFTQGA